MYEVKGFDTFSREWKYYNSFATYEEAADDRDRLERIYNIQFEVFVK